MFRKVRDASVERHSALKNPSNMDRILHHVCLQNPLGPLCGLSNMATKRGWKISEMSRSSVPIQHPRKRTKYNRKTKNTSSLSGFAFNSVGTAMLKIFPHPVFTRLLMNKLQPTANQVGWFKTLLVYTSFSIKYYG